MSLARQRASHLRFHSRASFARDTHSCRKLLLEALEPRQMLAFSIGTEFSAGTGPGFIPPDTMGAVGPDHIVELINGRYAVYNKTGVQQTATSLDQFWINSGVNPAGSFSFDPRILYDAASGRFFATAVDNARGPNNFLVAVSSSSDPTAGWSGFQIDADSNDSHWADFPMLGLDNEVVTVSANMFGLAGQATTATFLVMPKSDLLAGVPTVVNRTLFENFPNNITGASVQPVVDLTNGNLPLSLLAEFKEVGALKVSSIGGTAAAPTLNTAGGVIIVAARNEPPTINQPGPKANIEASDTRFSGNVILQQIPGRVNPSLWGVHGVNISGRAAVEWYEIDAVTNAVMQSGTISDLNLAYNYPSIAVNDLGDVVIGFSGGSPSTFMSTYVAVGHTTAGVTTFDPVTQTHAGVADYENLDSSGRNRWGDYSATVLDPTDQQRAWTFQEFASGTDQWSVRVTEIVLGSSVTGRHLFYNESEYDGNSPGIVPPAGGANNDDSDAIATDKSAYLPGGGLITPDSTSAYSRGINGLMIDMTGAHGTLGLADFEFSMSGQGALANNTPSTWVAAPAPTGFTVLTNTPVAGTDRVEFIWANNAIENRYLEVTVKGNDLNGGFNTNTGLAATDIFYFGNRIGDDFLATPPSTFNTTAGDEIDARNNPGFLQSLTNIYDYNKDSLVSAADQIIARNNAGFQLRIDIASPPAAPGSSPGIASADGANSAVTSALAISSAPRQLDHLVDPLTPPRRVVPGAALTSHFFGNFEDANDPRRAALLAVADDALDMQHLDDDLLRSFLR